MKKGFLLKKLDVLSLDSPPTKKRSTTQASRSVPLKPSIASPGVDRDAAPGVTPPKGAQVGAKPESDPEPHQPQPEALLDASTLERLANKTFATFFQHFVSSNFSIEIGGWAYQQINSSRPFDPVPGQSLHPGNGSTPQTPENVSRTAHVDIHTRVELLEVNAVAAWLSVAILAWFILAVIVVAVMEGRHLKRLIRDVECPADVLILISRSERLLHFVRNKDLEGQDGEDDGQVMTKLGWFQDSDSKERWGIEIVDDASERP